MLADCEPENPAIRVGKGRIRPEAMSSPKTENGPEGKVKAAGN